MSKAWVDPELDFIKIHICSGQQSGEKETGALGQRHRQLLGSTCGVMRVCVKGKGMGMEMRGQMPQLMGEAAESGLTGGDS